MPKTKTKDPAANDTSGRVADAGSAAGGSDQPNDRATRALRGAIPRYLASAAMGIEHVVKDGRIGSEAIDRYFEQELENTELASDPVARRLVEQILLAHHRVASLQAEAAALTRESVETDRVKLSLEKDRAAARYMSEIRQMAKALKAYGGGPQTSPPRKVEYHIAQQNVSHEGTQEITYASDSLNMASRMQCREPAHNQDMLGIFEPAPALRGQPRGGGAA